jgi:addiction module HigA family antidote
MTTTNGLHPIHPGEFLLEILTDIGLSQAQFARSISVSPMRISHVIKGSRPVTAELAHLFGKAFGQTPQYWMNLQVDYDLKTTAPDLQPRLQHVAQVPVAIRGVPRT